jgi:hypothetical protein
MPASRGLNHVTWPDRCMVMVQLGMATGWRETSAYWPKTRVEDYAISWQKVVYSLPFPYVGRGKSNIYGHQLSLTSTALFIYELPLPPCQFWPYNYDISTLWCRIYKVRLNIGQWELGPPPPPPGQLQVVSHSNTPERGEETGWGGGGCLTKLDFIQLNILWLSS